MSLTSTVTLEPSHLSPPEDLASGDEKSAGDFTCEFHQLYLAEENQQTRGAAWQICVFDYSKSATIGDGRMALQKYEGPCTLMWFGASQRAQACTGHAAIITSYESVMEGIARSMQKKAEKTKFDGNSRWP